MNRNIILAVIAVLLAAVPAQAAAPFGSFGGKVGGGNAAAGLLPLHGWALDDNGVEAVDILVDGVVAARAMYGFSRPGVAKKHPGYPDSNLSGYLIELDTTRYLNGNHTVSVRVKSRAGEVVTIGSRVFEFLNVTHALQPFGKIEFPNRQAEMRGNCNLADPARRFTVVSGYALDTGVDEDDTGVAFVELLIDRSLYANSRIDCRFSAAEGGLSDCYGLRRLDLEPVFPYLKDAPHSGFRFVLDIGVLINFFGYTPGAHVLTIRAGDHADQVRNIAEIPVTFTCDESLGNEHALGLIDFPRPGMLLGGVVNVVGWVLDWEGVADIQVLVDGYPQGSATHGFARPDVTAFYPSYPESAAAGFQFPLDTRKLSNGRHELEILVRDDLGVDTFIGKRQIVVNNPQ